MGASFPRFIWGRKMMRREVEKKRDQNVLKDFFFALGADVKGYLPLD